MSVAEPHLAETHLAEPHLAEPHLAEPHLEAPHLAEQILNAVREQLLNLPGIGPNVYRSRAEALGIDQLPALSLYQGSDQTLTEGPHLQHYDCQLSVHIKLQVKQQYGHYPETALNALRSQVSQHLHQHENLGLPFVIDMMEIGTEQPELLSVAEQQSASAEMLFRYHYRRLRATPTA